MPLVPEEQRVALLAGAAKALGFAMQSAYIAAMDAYIQMCNTSAPNLDKEQRAILLKEIKSSHTVQIEGRWRDSAHYTTLQNHHPEFYGRFEAMKKTLVEE